MSLSAIKTKALPVLRRNGVINAGIFGSVARGKSKKKSDIDFLVQFEGRRSLLDLVQLKRELEKTLHRRVDVVTYK